MKYKPRNETNTIIHFLVDLKSLSSHDKQTVHKNHRIDFDLIFWSTDPKIDITLKRSYK